jgi:hypothetical protein
LPGVPDIRFDDGSMGFGSYAGYPQVFHANIYSYSDMVSISHGKHNMKVGVDFRRNIENSEFNVARPSYYLPITSTLRQMRLTRKRLEWIRESLTARVLA